MSVVSKNPFDLLGDGDAAPAPAKKEAPKAAPARRGNEGAYRDKNAGRENNRNKPTGDGENRRPRGAPRGGRGGRPPRDDRHSKSVGGPGEKQADKAWGSNEGTAELKDEIAGQEIAAAEKTEEEITEAAEPEEVQKSYEQFLADKAAKKAALGETPAARQANEGTKGNKKWETAKPLEKEETDYFAASSSKSVRQRERKAKQTIDIEPRFTEPERPRGENRGGRGGPRGGFRGEGRGGRGPRGGARGGAPSASAPSARAPRQANINTKDESAFPSLGA